jgi:hypothetical protein
LGLNIKNLKTLFAAEIQEEIAKFPPEKLRIFSEEDITGLPEPVQNYFRHCGYIGRPITLNGKIFWKDVFFRRGLNDKWLKLDCFQFNSVSEPCRIVYMKSRLAEFLPFEGRDKYQNGRGNMLIKLLRFFTVQDAISNEMNISGLVTTLAETLLFPWQAVQPYIKWNQIDLFKAEAIIEFAGNKASGIFEFNEKFEMIRFVSNDRFQTQKDNSNINIRWAGIARNYIEKNGIKFPSSFGAVWYQPNGELEYFKGKIDNIVFNINSFDYN